jgi:23S rRNA pseudouridine1911/1915/1917 synthase
MQWRADVPDDLAALCAALGFNREEADDFDEDAYLDDDAAYDPMLLEADDDDIEAMEDDSDAEASFDEEGEEDEDSTADADVDQDAEGRKAARDATHADRGDPRHKNKDHRR